MTDNKDQVIESLRKEIVDLKIRLKRIEEYIIQNFSFEDPRTYITEEEDDELQHALKIVANFNTASASFLQRKLAIGYARAARLLDQMEAKDLVGPAEGDKPRKVNLKNIEKYFESYMDETT